MARGATVALIAAAICIPLAAGLAVQEQRQQTVMALAAYPGDVSSFPLGFVNTLRAVGFKGNIFLGVWEGTTDYTDYFKRNGVTPKYLRKAECKLRYSEISNNYLTRNICTEDWPHIKLDNARWMYAHKWLQECSTCDGWTMFADFSDINFQQNPFTLLPNVDGVPPETVYLTEEMRPTVDKHQRNRGVSTSHWLVKGAVDVCYGEEAGRQVSEKPMLNIASSFGTRAGMLRWLGDLAREFERLSYNADCDPVRICDQGVLNYLYYTKQDMSYATPKRYGEWIVNTMGVPCSNEPGQEPGHSMEDIVIIDKAGLVWNEDGSLPAVIHQGKVCHLNYIIPFVSRYDGTEDASSYRSSLPNLADAVFPGRK